MGASHFIHPRGSTTVLFSAHIMDQCILDVAEEILNRCTKLNPECDVYKDKFQVAFNYEFIEDARTQIESLTVKNPGASDNPTGDTANRYVSIFVCIVDSIYYGAGCMLLNTSYTIILKVIPC